MDHPPPFTRESINYRRSALRWPKLAAPWRECRIWMRRAMIDVDFDFPYQERLRANADRTT